MWEIKITHAACQCLSYLTGRPTQRLCYDFVDMTWHQFFSSWSHRYWLILRHQRADLQSRTLCIHAEEVEIICCKHNGCAAHGSCCFMIGDLTLLTSMLILQCPQRMAHKIPLKTIVTTIKVIITLTSSPTKLYHMLIIWLPVFFPNSAKRHQTNIIQTMHWTD